MMSILVSYTERLCSANYSPKWYFLWLILAKQYEFSPKYKMMMLLKFIYNQLVVFIYALFFEQVMHC